MATLRSITASVIGLSLAASGGCGRVIWRPDLQRATQEAGRDGRMVLVYLWEAFNPACAELDRTLFRSEEVLVQMRDMIPVRLDAALQRKEARQLGLTAPPSFAVISPDGELLRRTGQPKDVDQFLAFLVLARLSQ
jgi:hypothetical protein